jgi:hypothetical protein
MYSSRRSSVKRHIQNIHSGNGSFVSFVDYLGGRKLGVYLPSFLPTYQRKNDNNNKIDYLSIIKEELVRQSVRQKIGMS